jgi:hypothetical protein
MHANGFSLQVVAVIIEIVFEVSQTDLTPSLCDVGCSVAAVTCTKVSNFNCSPDGMKSRDSTTYNTAHIQNSMHTQQQKFSTAQSMSNAKVCEHRRSVTALHVLIEAQAINSKRYASKGFNYHRNSQESTRSSNNVKRRQRSVKNIKTTYVKVEYKFK